MTVSKAALLLLPNLLGETKHHELFLPPSVDRAVASLDGLIAESESGGRRFLSHFKTAKPPHQIPLAVLTAHPNSEEVDFYLEPLTKGERWGLIADAGLPCIADPGAELVRRARQMGIPIQAFIGPSSILLSLMLSGLPGQHFRFCGYIARTPEQRRKELLALQKVSREEKATQIFIEAPYRNQATLDTLLEALADETWLCVAWDLTLPTQGLVSQPIANWRKIPRPAIHKKPAIFLVYSEPFPL